MPFRRRSDRRALLVVLTTFVAVGAGILLDRWLLRPQNNLVHLDEVGMDTLESITGAGLAEQGKREPVRNDGFSGGYQSYAVSQESKPETFPFDPNTADSTSLLRLGFAPWQVRSIYKYRARGGRYHRVEDLKRVPGMTPELYKRLATCANIGSDYRYYQDSERSANASSASLRADSLHRSRRDSFASQRIPKFTQLTQVDLNMADSATLVRIPGIASYRARQILRYRERLGGFVDISQLAELDGFPAEELADWFKVETSSQRRLNLNRATVGQLGRHPYIGFARARAIHDYRRVHGTIHSLDDLQLLPEFSADVISRLAPYVTF